MMENLLYFMRHWGLDEKLIYKKAAEEQAIFVRDKICGNLLWTKGFVVSHHHSKSCFLPVYYTKMRNGIKVIMRGNFYDWKISVEIPEGYALPLGFLPEDCLSHGMVEGKYEKIPSCYLEGFKEEWAYDAYNPEHPSRKFTIETPDDVRLYVILHTLKHIIPDIVFKVEDDKRDIGEIESSIRKIYDGNGFNEEEEDTFMGKPAKRRVMAGWEILWRTHCKIDDLYYDGKLTVEEKHSVEDDPLKLAALIMKYPEIHQEFLVEEWLYSDNLDEE